MAAASGDPDASGLEGRLRNISILFNRRSGVVPAEDLLYFREVESLIRDSCGESPQLDARSQEALCIQIECVGPFRELPALERRYAAALLLSGYDVRMEDAWAHLVEQGIERGGLRFIHVPVTQHEVVSFPDQHPFASTLLVKRSNDPSLRTEYRKTRYLYEDTRFLSRRLSMLRLPMPLAYIDWFSKRPELSKCDALTRFGKQFYTVMYREQGSAARDAAAADPENFFFSFFDQYVRFQEAGIMRLSLSAQRGTDETPIPLKMQTELWRTLAGSATKIVDMGSFQALLPSLEALQHYITPCITYSHNDLHLDNVLVDGEYMTVLDWEKASLATPLLDIVTAVEHFYSAPENDPHSLFRMRGALYEMYGDMFLSRIVPRYPENGPSDLSIADIQGTCALASLLVQLTYGLRNHPLIASSSHAHHDTDAAFAFYRQNLRDGFDDVLRNRFCTYPDAVRQTVEQLQRTCIDAKIV